MIVADTICYGAKLNLRFGKIGRATLHKLTITISDLYFVINKQGTATKSKKSLLKYRCETRREELIVLYKLLEL